MNPEAYLPLLTSLPWWVPGLLVLGLGLLVCFWGYRILKIVLFLLGFSLGAYFTLLYGPALFPDQRPFVWGIAALALGSGAGCLIYVFFRTGVFILGACLGVALSLNFTQHMQDVAKWILLVLAGLAGGILGLKLEKWTMKAATSFLGAWHAVQGVFFLFKLSPFLLPWEQMLGENSGASLQDLADRPWYFWASVIGLSILGIARQSKGSNAKC